MAFSWTDKRWRDPWPTRPVPAARPRRAWHLTTKQQTIVWVLAAWVIGCMSMTMAAAIPVIWFVMGLMAWLVAAGFGLIWFWRWHRLLPARGTRIGEDQHAKIQGGRFLGWFRLHHLAWFLCWQGLVLLGLFLVGPHAVMLGLAAGGSGIGLLVAAGLVWRGSPESLGLCWHIKPNLTHWPSLVFIHHRYDAALTIDLASPRPHLPHLLRLLDQKERFKVSQAVVAYSESLRLRFGAAVFQRVVGLGTVAVGVTLFAWLLLMTPWYQDQLARIPGQALMSWFRAEEEPTDKHDRREMNTVDPINRTFEQGPATKNSAQQADPNHANAALPGENSKDPQQTLPERQESTTNQEVDPESQLPTIDNDWGRESIDPEASTSSETTRPEVGDRSDALNESSDANRSQQVSDAKPTQQGDIGQNRRGPDPQQSNKTLPQRDSSQTQEKLQDERKDARDPMTPKQGEQQTRVEPCDHPECEPGQCKRGQGSGGGQQGSGQGQQGQGSGQSQQGQSDQGQEGQASGQGQQGQGAGQGQESGQGQQGQESGQGQSGQGQQGQMQGAGEGQRGEGSGQGQQGEGAGQGQQGQGSGQGSGSGQGQQGQSGGTGQESAGTDKGSAAGQQAGERAQGNGDGSGSSGGKDQRGGAQMNRRSSGSLQESTSTSTSPGSGAGGGNALPGQGGPGEAKVPVPPPPGDGDAMMVLEMPTLDSEPVGMRASDQPSEQRQSSDALSDDLRMVGQRRDGKREQISSEPVQWLPNWILPLMKPKQDPAKRPQPKD